MHMAIADIYGAVSVDFQWLMIITSALEISPLWPSPMLWVPILGGVAAQIPATEKP